MFLVNSLNEKLKRTMNEMDTVETETSKFQYTQKPFSKAIISLPKEGRISEYTYNQLQSMSPKEWGKTFTLPKLKEKWNKKFKLNFNLNHKKFPDDLISAKVKESKTYIKDLIDPDVLGIKNKKWNNSCNPNQCNYPDVKKNIFEVSHGLNSCHVTKLKEKKTEEGVDSRNYLYVDGSKWNSSTILENSEKKENSEKLLNKAKINTFKHWRNTETDRMNESPLPISEDRKKLELTRFYKTYKSPKEDAIFRYSTMQKVKELTWIEREKTKNEVLKDNPANCNCIEKINSLIDKKLYNTYKDKYKELTDKSKKTGISDNSIKHWKDEEIVEKMKIKYNVIWK